MTVTLTGIGIHPVKSTAIRPVPSATVLPWGLDGDRRWMVIDSDGVLVSARELRTLFRVVADTAATDPALAAPLRLRAPGLADLELAEPESDLVPVRLHGNDLLARPAAAEAGAWFDAATGAAGLRLVWCDDPSRRVLNPAHSRAGDHTGFADGYPVTLASLSSLSRLNDWIAEAALERGEEPPTPLPVERFRANVVIDGVAPFDEDSWETVTIGEVRFRKAKMVDRCVMTTIAPADLASGKEPIRTLARHRLIDHKTWFAVHLIPEIDPGGSGRIAVGDRVVAGG
ncbi:MOSC domain-containing protein [Marmoricola sp. RAF53]|uniref:MOSC domain-containing protein n=1 Tax=Marmoricola sp. RAF53 TaxID=3233059 RepID=UPI003F996D8B